MAPLGGQAVFLASKKGSMVGQRIGLIDRIDLDERTGCWNWRGHRGQWGYGSVRDLEGRKISASRFAAILWLRLDPHDPRPVCHKCNNPACFNPKHLYIGSHSQNVLDSVRAGTHGQARKTHCSNGHEFNDKNTHSYFITRIRKGKSATSFERQCRVCQKGYTRLYLLNKRDKQKEN